MAEFDLIASCAFGLEAVVRYELTQMGIDARMGPPGQLFFRGGPDVICRTNLWLRTADRIRICIARFPAGDFDALFDTTQSLDWKSWLPRSGAFPVAGRSVKSQLSSVPAVQRTVKKAIVTRLQEQYAVEELPESEEKFPLEISLLNDEATLTLDTTGASLHKRGYRSHNGPAPLKETMAAALVQLSFWRGTRPLIDPFCGTGTIPIEAAMLGRNMAPGLNRTFACEQWRWFPQALWDAARVEAHAAALDDLPVRLIGTDRDYRSLTLARDNAVRAGVDKQVHFQEKDFCDLTSKKSYGCLITNPPYGKRLGELAEVEPLYESMPDVLSRLPTWSHFILTAFPLFERTVQKQADRRRKLYNGRIECTYFQFHGPKPPRDLPTDSESLAEEAETSTTIPRSDNASLAERVASGTAIDKDSDQADTLDQVAAPAPEPRIKTHEAAPGPVDKTPVDQGLVVESRADESLVDAELKPSAPTVADSDDASIAGTSEELDDASDSASDSESRERPRRARAAPAFGGLDPKANEQAELFASRLSKRARHLRRWPTRKGITCFRLYERDIPEIPLVVDRYEDHLHIVEFERPNDRDRAQHTQWLDKLAATAAETLDVPAKQVFLKRRQRQRGTDQHEKYADVRYEIVANEGGLKFYTNLSDYADTGLFLDHRQTRAMVRDVSRDKRFLNLFAYTGSFTVYAADAPAASTTTVDLSPVYLAWAQRNMRLNDFTGPQHQFVRSDILTYLRQLPQEPMFDVAVVDPPTFSNSKRTDEVWDIQQNYVECLNELLVRIESGGTVFFSTNFRRFKFDENQIEASAIREISRQTVPEDYRNQRIHRCWRITR